MYPKIENNNLSNTYYLDFRYIFNDYKSIKRGLMYIKKPLSNDSVALFIMPEFRVQGFWMKNTYISLDMIFLSPEGVVMGYKENTKPLDESSYSINFASKYVIEANGGFVEKYNLKKGDIIKLPIKNQKLIKKYNNNIKYNII